MSVCPGNGVAAPKARQCEADLAAAQRRPLASANQAGDSGGRPLANAELMTAVDSPLGTKKGNDGMAPRRGCENLKNNWLGPGADNCRTVENRRESSREAGDVGKLRLRPGEKLAVPHRLRRRPGDAPRA